MTVQTIGIVANPASGKDVRRLVARASVFDNREKCAIIRRALSGAINAGGYKFAFLDDSHNIAGGALLELGEDCDATRCLHRVLLRFSTLFWGHTARKRLGQSLP
ncbi:MAG: hypothetical protein ACNYPE_12490 [Candidatus Azotimanducaceae bacterium WSBS_2022_MAG_OTU7]